MQANWKTKITALAIFAPLTLLGSTAFKTDISVAQTLPDSYYRSIPAFSIKLNPQQSIINTESAVGAVPIDLLSLGINPGDLISIERFGYISLFGPSAIENWGYIHAAFSTSAELLPNTETPRNSVVFNSNRIPGAVNTLLPRGDTKRIGAKLFQISLGQNEINGGYNGISVEVPANARYLFIGVNDGYYPDNVDSNGDFAVGITKFVEP